MSIILVPTTPPGSAAPSADLAASITNATFYEDVRVPVANLVGAENGGWKLITNQLNHERVAICPASGHPAQLQRSARGRSDTDLADGRLVIDQEWVQIDARPRVHAESRHSSS